MADGPADQAPAAKKKKRRRRRSRKAASEGEGGTSARPEARTAEALAREALAGIDRLVTRLSKELGVVVANNGHDEPPEVVLPLRLPLSARGPAKPRAAALLGELQRRIKAAAEGADAFREGRVYCFYTSSPDSPYSTPPHPVDVFAGYGATGKPEWVSFPNLCLERKEPRVDRLYGEAPEVLALTQGPGELDEGLLPGFGRGSLAYRLLGQVVLGLVPRDLDPRSSAERVALSLQIVETSQPGLRHRLRLNVVGLDTQAIAQAAAEQPATSAAEAFRKLLRATRSRVDALGRRAALAHRRGEALELDPHVKALLSRLRTDVLRVLKSRDYRTRHAEHRHRSRERPTSLAVTDALGAGDGRLLRDEHKDTIIVLGPRHRVHVFSSAGRHVTSLELMPTEVDRRIELKRWRYLGRVGSELFRATLKRALDREPSEPSGEV